MTAVHIFQTIRRQSENKFQQAAVFWSPTSHRCSMVESTVTRSKNISSVTAMQWWSLEEDPATRLLCAKKKKHAWKSSEDLQNVKRSGNSRREEPVPEDLHLKQSYAFKKSSVFDDNRDKQQQEQRGARGTNDLRPLSVVLSWSSFRGHQASNSTDTEWGDCAPEFKLWAAIYILYIKIEWAMRSDWAKSDLYPYNSLNNINN